jgi:hypothetical protein
MIFFKILAPIVVLAIAFIKDILPKKPKGYKHTQSILIGLMIAAASIGVITIVLDDQRSKEDAQLQLVREAKLQRSNDSLTSRVDSLLSIAKNSESKFDVQNAILQARVSELNSKLEPFIKIAVGRYPSLEIQPALARLAEDVRQAKELARPAALQFTSKQVKKIPGGYVLTLEFRPDKNVALGSLEFLISLPKDSKARITDVEPTLDGGAIFCGDNYKKLSPDGKSARLAYAVGPGGFPVFEVKLSDITEVAVEGNNGLTPFTVRVQ